MTQDEIIEMAIQGHAGTRDAIRWAMQQEREACAKVCDELPAPDIYNNTDKSMWEITCIDCAEAIRARGQGTSERGQA
jgi:hypothetical protein